MSYQETIQKSFVFGVLDLLIWGTTLFIIR